MLRLQDFLVPNRAIRWWRGARDDEIIDNTSMPKATKPHAALLRMPRPIAIDMKAMILNDRVPFICVLYAAEVFDVSVAPFEIVASHDSALCVAWVLVAPPAGVHRSSCRTTSADTAANALATAGDNRVPNPIAAGWTPTKTT